MNPVPIVFRFSRGLGSIKAQVNAWALAHDCPTFDEQPTAYRFSGWGTVGFPPRLACNVYYLDGETVQDLGRIAG